MTDQELLNFMREQFDNVCFGDTGYLEETCLDRLAAGVRSGYTGFHGTDGRGSYHDFSQETRWDGSAERPVLAVTGEMLPFPMT